MPRLATLILLTLAACTSPEGQPSSAARFFQGGGATHSLSGAIGAAMSGEVPASQPRPVRVVTPPPDLGTPQFQPMVIPPLQPMGMGFNCTRFGNMVHCDGL